jgi:predicted nucleic acid-binding protein
MILECALAAEADFLVSHHEKHLVKLRRFREIPIVNPAEFLRCVRTR